MLTAQAALAGPVSEQMPGQYRAVAVLFVTARAGAPALELPAFCIRRSSTTRGKRQRRQCRSPSGRAAGCLGRESRCS